MRYFLPLAITINNFFIRTTKKGITVVPIIIRCCQNVNCNIGIIYSMQKVLSFIGKVSIFSIEGGVQVTVGSQ